MLALLHGFVQDMQFGRRQLLRTPGFTLVCVLTLALGVGATTAIFSLVNSVLLRPFPYKNPERLVQLFSVYEGNLNSTVSAPNFLDWREQSLEVLEGAALINKSNFTLTGSGEPERLQGARVTPNLFSLLGVGTIAGRTFRPDEGSHESQAAVLSEALWSRRFGRDEAVIGRTLTLSGRLYTVIGVVSKESAYPPSGADVWLPLALEGDTIDPSNRGAFNFNAIARLASGVSVEAAQARTVEVGRRLEEHYPEHNSGWGLRIEPLSEQLVGDVRTPLLVLLGAVGCVLLIACANIANLLLARAASRETEMGVRSALGAGRVRIARQLLTESLLLSAVGGITGLLLAVALVRGLIRIAPERIPRLEEAGLDPIVLLFSAGIVFVTGVLFGLAPALHASKPDISQRLKQGVRGSQGRPGRRLRHSLVVVEVALSVMLLAGAGLLIRSFTRLIQTDLGFQTEQISTFNLILAGSKYSEPERLRVFTSTLIDRLKQIPGTKEVAVAFGLPFSSNRMSVGFEIEGAPPWPAGKTEVLLVRIVTPDYFRTMGIPLTRGRAFTERDRKGSPTVMIVNQSAMARYFRNTDPLGKKIKLGWAPEDESFVGEIIGLVGDSRQYSVEQKPEPEVFIPYEQAPVGSYSVVVRSISPPAAIATASRAQLREIDPNLPLIEFQALEDLVASSISRAHFYMLLLGTFAVMALILAIVGIYGVISHVVAQSRREIGIRMALGATRRQVINAVLRQGFALTTLGTGIGLAGALFVNRGLASLLYGISTGDPFTLSLVTLLLFLVASLAVYLPGRRAAWVEPYLVLREE